MEFLVYLFVAKPLNIFLVALLFLTGYLLIRFTKLGIKRAQYPMFVATLAWALYATWEFFVQFYTPEANIRVDLLLIWPLLAIISGWAFFRLFR